MELTWTRVIVGGFALATAMAGGVWALRADRIDELESRVDYYEKAERWAVPKTLEAMEKVNRQIAENLSKLTDYQALQERNKVLQEQTEKLSGTIADLQANVTTLRNDLAENAKAAQETIENLRRDLKEKEQVIADLVPHDEAFMISERQSKTLFLGAMTVGVLDVGSEAASVSVNNERKQMSAGEFVSQEIAGKLCKLFVEQIFWAQVPEKVSFRVLCVEL